MFSDLKQERQATVETILVAGHMPAGMEWFAAGDESQLEVIRKWIDDSDVYMLILGGDMKRLRQRTGEVQAGKLAALIGVENFRLAVTVDRSLPRFLAEGRVVEILDSRHDNARRLAQSSIANSDASGCR